jgi:xanthine dehydrogenase YagR molybdenum-binding subunit
MRKNITSPISRANAGRPRRGGDEAHVYSRGNAAKAFAQAPVRVEAEYRMPVEHHNAMEMFGVTAVWEGDGRITVYDKTQGPQNCRNYIANVFSLRPDDVRVLCPYVGGAFGSGLRPQYELPLAVLAARALKRSVQVALTRQQMFTLGYRAANISRWRWRQSATAAWQRSATHSSA